MDSTALIFNFLRGRDTVTPHLRRISTAALRASRQLQFVGRMTGVIWLTAAGAIGGAAAAAVAFTSALAPLAGALGALPAVLFATAGGLAAVIMGFRGIGAAMKTTTAAGGAANSLAAAERRVEQAQKAALKAQQAVNDARAEAARRLADVTRELARARLDEESAVLGVREAQMRLAEARRSGDRLEIARANIAYRQAVQAVEDVRLQVAELAEEEADRTAKGVEGSDEVRDATERHAEALEDVAEAQRALNQAMSGGGGPSKAAQAYAKLSAEGKRLVDVLKAIGPAWASVRLAVQSAVLAGVAEDLRLVSAVYLPVMRRQLPAIGQGWNNAFRGGLQVAATAGFVADMNLALASSATMWQRVGASVAPGLDALRQWVAVGSAFLPRLGQWVLNLAQGFAEWSARVRDTGQAHQWIERALEVGRQFNELISAWSASLVKIFSLGADPAFLQSLIAGSQAFRDWLDTAEGQQRVTGLFAEFRAIGSAAWAAFKTGVDVLSQLDLSGVATSFTILNAVLKVLGDNMGLINAILPVLIPLYVIHKTNVTALRIAYGLWGAVTAVATFYLKGLAVVIQFTTAALGRKTAATGAARAGTVLYTVATKAAAAAARAWAVVANLVTAAFSRQTAAMVIARAAMLAGAAATGIMTAAQWLMAPSTWAALGPILLIVLAIAAVIAIVIIVIKYHKEIGAFIAQVWQFIWDKIKAFGSWLWNDFAPMLLNALTFPYRMAWQAIQFVWGLITGAATAARDWVIDKLLALVGFVTSLPGRMRAAAVGLWDGLKDSFRAALNWLISRWNNFSLTLGGGNVMGMNIPSVTLSTPNIPLLDVGGHVTQTGLAVVHRGEDVVPARTSPLGGGRRDVVVLRSDGSQLSDWVMELLRKALRERGGNMDTLISLSNG